MTATTARNVYMFVYCWCYWYYYGCYGKVLGMGPIAVDAMDDKESPCCPLLLDPLPRYAVASVSFNRTECGPGLFFHLFSGETICAPVKGWAKTLACHMDNENGAFGSVSWVFQQVAKVLKQYALRETARGDYVHPTIDVETFDFMYAVSDIDRSPPIHTRRYEYRVWDGISWLSCVCDLRLRMTSKLFPKGTGFSKPKASISYTLDITFSATSGDLFTKCTHNHLYDRDVFYGPLA